jgi:hypothetical protein
VNDNETDFDEFDEEEQFADRVPDISDVERTANSAVERRLEYEKDQVLWLIPWRFRQAMVNRQIELAVRPQFKPSEATAAFRALLSAEDQNIAVAKIASARSESAELTMVGDIVQIRTELLNNAAFLEVLRSHAAYGNARSVCDDGQSESLETGESFDAS